VEEGTHLTTDGWEEETWYTAHDLHSVKIGTLYAAGVGHLADARRRRVKLIEAQYRKPARVQIVEDGPLRGAIFNPSDRALADAVGRSGSMIVDKLMMRVHIAIPKVQYSMSGESVSRFSHPRPLARLQHLHRFRSLRMPVTWRDNPTFWR
jgi:hypothetical protein